MASGRWTRTFGRNGRPDGIFYHRMSVLTTLLLASPLGLPSVSPCKFKLVRQDVVPLTSGPIGHVVLLPKQGASMLSKVVQKAAIITPCDMG
jgi:hypothetical protein